jgi:adenylate cyclase
MAKLVLISRDPPLEFTLSRSTTIGRHPANDIQLLDALASKEHATIERTTDGRFLLRDHRSLNGTLVGGERVSERFLSDGDMVAIGSSRFTFVERPSSVPSVTIAPSQPPDAGPQPDSYVHITTPPGMQFLPAALVHSNEALRLDYEKLRVEHELWREIRYEKNLERLLSRSLDKAFEVVTADRGVVFLIDPRGELVVQHAKTREGAGEVVVSETILEEVRQSRMAVLSTDLPHDQRFRGSDSIFNLGLQSVVSVPLLTSNDEILGILHLESHKRTAFTEKDLQIASGIAMQAAVAIENIRLAARIEDETRARAQFQRLLSPNLVEEVVAGRLRLEKGGELREATILFADIRGFTRMSESMEAHDLVAMLNEYFELMVGELFRFGGTLDKFVGDQIMALFGAPLDMPNAPLRALGCAMAMQARLGEWSHTRSAEGLPPVAMGVGVCTGKVVTGAIGTSTALQYTAIGDAVNMASRLCALAAAGEVLAGEGTLALCQGQILYQPLEPVLIKGKRDRIPVFRITGMPASTPTRAT